MNELDYVAKQWSAIKITPDYAEKMMEHAFEQDEKGSAVSWLYGNKWVRGSSGNADHITGPYYVVLQKTNGRYCVTKIDGWDIDGLLASAARYNFTSLLGHMEPLN